MELVIILVMCILVFGLLGSGGGCGGGGCTIKLGEPTRKRPPRPVGQGIVNKPKEEIEVQDDNT